jgi:hypothetical protein
LRKLLPLVERLHDDGCERDKAGNRRLHLDQSSTLVLLYLFNPVVVSLRSLQQARELQKVQKLLGCKRASLGSLSEAMPREDLEVRMLRDDGRSQAPITGRLCAPTDRSPEACPAGST